MITNNSMDTVLAESLLNESRAATAASKSATVRNVGVAVGAVALGCGLAASAVIWAMNAKTDPVLLRQAMESAFAHMGPVPVKGEVTVADGGEVKLKDGGIVTTIGEVSLKDGAEVYVRDHSVITAEPQVTAAGDAIKRGITVFSTVDAPGGSVHTGWDFADGKTGQSPVRQFCYYQAADSDPAKTINTYLATDRAPLEVSRSQLTNFDTLLGKCVWWKPGAV